jgi:hypothetical protein
MTIAQLYPFTVYATTPGGHRFAVASYRTRDDADRGAAKHWAAHRQDRTTIQDNRPRWLQRGPGYEE